MKQLLWLKFYPKDWNGDHNVRACSLAARGLLAALLEPMHEADPYGHLLVRGKKPDYAELAVLASCTTREVKYGIEELLKNHVLSTNTDGIWYSRRMVRDAERRAKQAAGGRRSMASRIDLEHSLRRSRGDLEPISNRARTMPTQQNQVDTDGNSRVVLERSSAEAPRPIEARDQRLEKNKNSAAESVPHRNVGAPAAEKVPSPTKDFLTWFQAEYKTRRNGATYFVKWESHGKLVKDLLRVFPPDRLKKHAQILLTTDEDWTSETDRGIGVLSTKINWLEERLCAWEVKRKAREAV